MWADQQGGGRRSCNGGVMDTGHFPISVTYCAQASMSSRRRPAQPLSQAGERDTPPPPPWVFRSRRTNPGTSFSSRAGCRRYRDGSPALAAPKRRSPHHYSMGTSATGRNQQKRCGVFATTSYQALRQRVREDVTSSRPLRTGQESLFGRSRPMFVSSMANDPLPCYPWLRVFHRRGNTAHIGSRHARGLGASPPRGPRGSTTHSPLRPRCLHRR